MAAAIHSCSEVDRSVSQKGKSFSIIRLNADETGYGVVDDATGALVRMDGLALKLTKERAREVSALMNAEAKERGEAGEDMKGVDVPDGQER